MNTALVGAQWGDEGKGKVIDILAEKADVVMRGSGGNNAGHTVVVDGREFKLHLIPSGIMYPGKLCLIGAGCVVDPVALLEEMEEVKKGGITDFSGLKLDYRAHMVMPYHLLIDKLSELALGELGIGTTKKGIGPCYMDKAERSGLRAFDIANADIFKEKLARALELKKKYVKGMYGDISEADKAALDFDKIFGDYTTAAKKLAPYFADTALLVYEQAKLGKNILFEGAQGTLLDNDFGTYPYVTSSHPISGGFTIGCGVGPNIIDDVLGIAKAYTTRVGEGPFPTELNDEIGQYIRDVGAEYGATTKRPRRCGWLDCVILRYSVRINGLTRIALNKLDTLTGLKELKVCVAYKMNGKVINELPADISELEKCEPVYETLPGWTEDITGAKKFDDLPKNTKDYIAFIEKQVDCKIKMAGVGKERSQSFHI